MKNNTPVFSTWNVLGEIESRKKVLDRLSEMQKRMEKLYRNSVMLPALHARAGRVVGTLGQMKMVVPLAATKHLDQMLKDCSHIEQEINGFESTLKIAGVEV